MAKFDDLNHNLAPEKSIFDNQRLKYPNIYKICGRTSFTLGVICIFLEIAVFILKRGFPSWGIGIWTGVPFVVTGAVTMAVPKTMTVCAVNTCFLFSLCCLILSTGGAVTSIHVIQRTTDVISKGQYVNEKNELITVTCRSCANFIIAKEVIQIIVSIVECFCVVILSCFAFKDSFCCTDTETEVFLPPLTSVVTENSNTLGSPASSVKHACSHSVLKNHCSTLPGSSSTASVHRNYAATASPMLYEL